MGHTFLEKRRSPPTNTISTTYICSCNHIHTYMHTYTYTCAEVGGEGGAAEHRRLGASRTAYSLNLQGLGGNRGSYWRMKVNEGAYNIFTYVYIYIYIYISGRNETINFPSNAIQYIIYNNKNIPIFIIYIITYRYAMQDACIYVYIYIAYKYFSSIYIIIYYIYIHRTAKRRKRMPSNAASASLIEV